MDSFKAAQEDQKRLFIGIKITPSEKLLDVFNAIKSSLSDCHIKWAIPKNFHITIRFLGNTPSNLIDTLQQTIAKSVVQCNCLNLELESIGTFGRSKPKILCIGIKENQDLINIYQTINTALETKGYNFKDNLFHPHLTLGRIKQIHSDSIINEIKTEQGNRLIQKLNVSEISLFESVINNEEIRYTILQSYKLG